MIKKIQVCNFKSIEKVSIELGTLNVLIGENGAGKSNLLEALALVGAATAGKLDNEFLASRGVRTADPNLMKSAFYDPDPESGIEIKVYPRSGYGAHYKLINDGEPYSAWHGAIDIISTDGKPVEIPYEHFITSLQSYLSSWDAVKDVKSQWLRMMADKIERIEVNSKSNSFSLDMDADSAFADYLARRSETGQLLSKLLSEFIIFSPENSALRDFSREGQILPLGINGEGLLKLLDVEISGGEDFLAGLNKFLSLLGWFDRVDLHKKTKEYSVSITDRYLCEVNNQMDIKAANEGFLFLLFYYALFSSRLTPRFFAVDNIDASLNPKLCKRLIEELYVLAKKNDKQVILTTHNPAILDGLNLDDAEQRLFAVSRKLDGSTKVRRIEKKHGEANDVPVKLSEEFMRGSLGGLPKGF